MGKDRHLFWSEEANENRKLQLCFSFNPDPTQMEKDLNSSVLPHLFGFSIFLCFDKPLSNHHTPPLGGASSAISTHLRTFTSLIAFVSQTKCKLSQASALSF